MKHLINILITILSVLIDGKQISHLLNQKLDEDISLLEK
ncbi:hypothetical protein J2S19_002384 [Metabacillus malikii]|uniref:Uncharacterized protein n=1 Tax=Metabacillus malikii TaxID=1504265 RepID=A0ABT9ZFR8_9BACI|nr:hypothetical protein [Metabacillus malikii]